MLHLITTDNEDEMPFIKRRNNTQHVSILSLQGRPNFGICACNLLAVYLRMLSLWFNLVGDSTDEEKVSELVRTIVSL